MILKGSQRAGGRQMAVHLLNGKDNEHVTIHQIRGFIASDVLGALNEAYALSKGTQCKQFMYSLSLNPPQDEKVGIETFEGALERIEKKLGLEDQPRVVVFHEKEGRRHAHCVWSRIDIEDMKAINIAFPKRKLNAISKSLYLEHGWKMPKGFRDKTQKNPLNYTRAEWQQAARIGRKAPEIKRELQECWAYSDNKRSFDNALQDKGYYLARGDKRGFVAVDLHGEVYSLSRQLGQKTKSLEARLGRAEILPSVTEVKAGIHGRLAKLFKTYTDELTAQHKTQAQPLHQAKAAMIKEQRKVREELSAHQKKRWQSEEIKRSSRIRKGFQGIWDKLNGRYWKTRKRNEQETWKAGLRDQNQREELIQKQLNERQNLQAQFKSLHDKQDKERKSLIRDLSHITKNEEAKKHKQVKAKTKDNQSKKDPFSDHERDDPDIDFEPEI